MQNRIINEEGSIHSLYINLINKYLYFLFCVFLIFSLFIGLFLKDIPISLFFIFYFIQFFFLIGKIKKSDCSKKVLNTLVSSIIIALTFHISFFHVYNYKDVGDEYFYFFLTFLPFLFFFDYKTQRNIVYVLVLFILLNFVVVESFDLNFIPRNRFLKDTDYKVLKLVNVMMSVTTFFFSYWFYCG